MAEQERRGAGVWGRSFLFRYPELLFAAAILLQRHLDIILSTIDFI